MGPTRVPAGWELVVRRLGAIAPNPRRTAGIRFLWPVIDQGVPVDMRPRILQTDSVAWAVDGTGLKVEFSVRWQVVDSVEFVRNVYHGEATVAATTGNLINWAIASKSPEAALAAGLGLPDRLAPQVAENLNRWGCRLLGFEVKSIALAGRSLKLGPTEAGQSGQ